MAGPLGCQQLHPFQGAHQDLKSAPSPTPQRAWKGLQASAGDLPSRCPGSLCAIPVCREGGSQGTELLEPKPEKSWANQRE